MTKTKDILIAVCPSEVHSPSGVRWKTLYNDLCDELCSIHVDSNDSDFKSGADWQAQRVRGLAYKSLRRGGIE